MKNCFWDNKQYKCPKCGRELTFMSSIFTEDIQQQTVNCSKCDKIFDITYKIVFDSINEYEK